ncbi:MAG TPA: M28 family peptidase [Gemmatimonas sp.]|uniref:M28 family peptidase n=1 Tax=Gemmatimonas sp. TaxID=1962908 RepID=UPI002ED9918C
MRRTIRLLPAALPLAFALTLLPAVAPTLGAQEKEDRTLLNWEQMRAIIMEASGERAMHHVMEFVPYQRVRQAAEYTTGPFRESRATVDMARQYGYSSANIETFPSAALWQPSKGQLWVSEKNGPRKLHDIFDTPVALGTNTPTGDVSGELIDVGNGSRPEDFAGKDVKGKVVMGSAPLNTLQRMAVFERGAVGVLSWNSMRPIQQPDIMVSSAIVAGGMVGGNSGFGWLVTTRQARDLQVRLERGEQITVRSVVESQTFPGRQEVIHLTIDGDGSTNQDVIVSAHIFEGLIKQGANDDNSGAALILEMGRTYIELIKAGKLPKPKRTIHFLFVQEIAGTNAWLNAHPDVKKRIIADLNYDMEGLRLTTAGATWLLMRSPDSFPSFLNDICQNFMEFVSEITRERVRYRHNGYAPALDVLSPNGSRDPFYIKIDKYYGASDHATYMQHGIPAVIFNTWPDPWYHSSQDTPDKLDPTQFKRAAVVSVGAMTVLASADDNMALRVAADVLGRGAERMAANQRKGLSYIGDITSADQLAQAYTDAKATVRHQANIEKSVIKSVSVLFADPAAAEKRLTATYIPLIDARAASLQAEVKATYTMAAANWKVAATEPAMSALELEAGRTLVQRTPPAAGAAPAGPGGGGGGGARPAPTPTRIPQHMTSELNAVVGRGMSILDIRDFISGQFEPVPLQDVWDHIKNMEKAGTVTLTNGPVRRTR